MTRIDGLTSLQTSRMGQSHGPEAAQGDEHRAAESGSANGRGDEVRLSNRGRVVAEAMRSVHAAPEVREEKIAALKAAIADGTYTSNAREIAARLLASGALEVD